MDIKDELVVAGYKFQTPEDAALARGEIQKIELIKQKLDLTDAKSVLMLYEKAIESRSFITPVGLHFMNEMRAFLLTSELNVEEVSDIPVSSIHSVTKREEIMRTKKSEATKKMNSDLRKKLTLSRMVIFILSLAILAMFAITLNSKNPTILNYKQKLENYYSGWEEELKDRENIVREKELELKLNSDFTE